SINPTPSTETYTLSLHDALPISSGGILPHPDEVGAQAAHPGVGEGGAENLGRIALGRPLTDAARSRFPTPCGSHYQIGRVETQRSEEHTSELQSRGHLVCRLLLE